MTGNLSVVRRTWFIISALAAGLIFLPASAPAAATDAAEPATPRVTLNPSTFDRQKAQAGDVLTYELRVSNSTDDVIRLHALALALEGSSNPSKFAQVGGRAARGQELLDWVRFPGFTQGQPLKPGQARRIRMTVTIPTNPPAGTFALGPSISWTVVPLGVDTDSAPAGRVRLNPTLTSVAVIQLPGDAAAQARVTNVTAPRVLWFDRRATFGARVTNVGDTDLVIDAKVDLDSFVGTASRTLNAAGPKAGQPTLPGGVRDVTMRWNDPPLLGWFQPELVVVGGKGSGVRITKPLDTVYVLPPWWLIVLTVIAIAMPIRSIRRRTRHRKATGADRSRAVRRVQERERKAAAKRRAAEHRRRHR